MTCDYQTFKTAQSGVHVDLIERVKKYASRSFLRPIPTHQLQAFESIKTFAHRINRPLILDSGCGTGLSSQRLAEQFPDHGVIGIDKSAARLGRARLNSSDNLLLVRGDLVDQWRLLAQHRLPIARHYLLFPNPWPKISHLGRRFYGHPVFGPMISLAPYFELRTNWSIYAKECLIAIETLRQAVGSAPHADYKTELHLKADSDYLSLFEKKYVAAGCPIYVLKSIHTISQSPADIFG